MGRMLIGLLLSCSSSQTALDEAILADEFLMYCAGHAEDHIGSFDLWWRICNLPDNGNFAKGVRARYRKARPDDNRIPTNDEIAQRLQQLIKTHRVEMVNGYLQPKYEVPVDPTVSLKE